MIGNNLTKYFELRNKKDQINRDLKEVNLMLMECEAHLIDEMETLNLDKIENDSGSLSKKVGMYPNVEDKEAFVRWCVLEKRFDMLEKRVSRPAFIEFYENTNQFPDGVNTHTQTKLLMRRKK